MKCIDDELIQRCIDGETNLFETEQIKKHIADCPSCADRIEEKKAFAKAIKNDMQNFGNRFVVVVPDFEIPTTRTEARSASSTKLKRRLNLNFRHIVYVVSAACVAAVMLFVLLPERQENEAENEILMYTVIKDFDANRTYCQQEESIYMIDSDGNLINIMN